MIQLKVDGGANHSGSLYDILTREIQVYINMRFLLPAYYDFLHIRNIL